jgi:hypothetical protein
MTDTATEPRDQTGLVVTLTGVAIGMFGLGVCVGILMGVTML